MMRNLRPFYIVYAGSFHPDGVGSDPEMPQYFVEVWSPRGNDIQRAINTLTTYQQEGYDFCGIEIMFES